MNEEKLIWRRWRSAHVLDWRRLYPKSDWLRLVASLAIIVVSVAASVYYVNPGSSQQTVTFSSTTTSTFTSTVTTSPATTSTTSFTTSTFTISTVTSSTAGCPSCLVAPQNQLAVAISYFTSRFNPQVGLISAGTQTTCTRQNGTCGGVQFYYMDGSACPIVPQAYRYLPNENWAVAAALDGMGADKSIVASIYSHLLFLQIWVGWRPADNRESQWGYIISSSKANTNVCFTVDGGPPLPFIDGSSISYDQAARWNTTSQSWIPGEFKLTDSVTNGMSAFDEAGFQALNLYLRGDTSDAKANLQWMANQCTVNSDGSVGFGSPPYRGMFLSVFLEAEEVIGAPLMKPGCSISAIADTIWGIQQPDGGIARQYRDVATCPSTCLGSDDETTNAALLAYSPGVILFIQEEAAHGGFNMSSIPSVSPAIGI